MAEFTVSEVIDGHTFEVKEGWQWEGKRGNTIRPTGYDAPEKGKPGYEEAKQKLKRLILHEKVEIKIPQDIDDWGRLVTDIYYKDRNLADYFPEYKT